MNISKEQVDALNAIVTIQVAKEDYATKVENVLEDYRKKANIPGFRKGAVPMSFVKKQNGKAILLDEVNKIIQGALNKFITEEKLDILGNPLPKMTEDFDWDADDFKFQFELGLTPEFTVDVRAIAGIQKYNIVAEDSLIDEQVERIQKQYGKMSPKDTVDQEDTVNGTFTNEEKDINAPASISLKIFKDKATGDQFLGKKAGDVIALDTKGLFEDDHDLMTYLKVSHDDVHGLDVTVDFTIESINSTEPAELNQELFDKLFGEGNVTSLEELKAKIKEDAEKQFAPQADQKFMGDISDYLLANTKFDLPSDFLKRWLQNAGQKQLTTAEAEAEFAKSEKGLRYQLIEGKIVNENKLQITFEDLKAFASKLIKAQMAMYGQLNPSDKEVEDIVARVLSNQDEIKRLSEQAMSEKILNFYKENILVTEQEVSYQDFIKISYGE